MSKEIQEIGEQVAKKQLKPTYRNNFLQTGGAVLDDGDNAKILDVNIKLFNMEKVDLHDPDAVTERLSEFFELCVKLFGCHFSDFLCLHSLCLLLRHKLAFDRKLV